MSDGRRREGTAARWLVRGAAVGLAMLALFTLVGAFGQRAPLLGSPSADAQPPTPTTPQPGTSPTIPAPADTDTGTDTGTGTGTGTGTDERTGPAVVTVGFLINDIQDIDLARHRYQIDFYVWYRWTDPDIDPPASVEFMNDAERWATMRTPATDGPVRLADGSLYFREHIMSMFKSNLPLEDYPYDQLDLEIIMEDVAATTDELIFVLDDPAVEETSTLSVPGYELEAPSALVTEWAYPTMGETDVGPSTVSRVVVTVPLTRPWIPSSAKIFIPLIVVVLCAAIVFLVHPQHVDARFGLGISSLLTLVALKWITDSELPLMDYLGLVDSLYLLAFMFVGAGLAETTYATWQRGRGVDDAVLVRTGRRTFAIAASAFVVSCVLVIVVFLS